jgi:leucyl/phenylalanyl-tRNA--protein transferase
MIPIPLLLEAYRRGAFPMGIAGGSIEWYSPDPRGILPLEQFHVPRRLSRVLRLAGFEVRFDTAFRDVIRACASRQDDDGTWITPVICDTYVELHARGHAHSVEAWRDGRLAGGLYGVSLGGAFFGESMFHRETDASKVALVGLVDRLRARGFTLLDVQWVTPHLEQFGATEISRRRYLRLLADALTLECTFD